MMPEITLSHIHKSIAYGFCKKKKVLEDLSLSIEQGEVFGFIGPNGAGKSTLINLIMGFTRPDSGSISIHGSPPTVPSIRKGIGYLPENARYHEHLTPNELLRFCGKVSDMHPADIKQRTNSLLDRVGLLNERKRPLRTFSKGMKQRMGLCMAMIHDPGTYILDEPMSGLDPLGRSMIQKIILEEKKRRRTVFFSTHILNDVQRLCDRIAVIHLGKILYCGSVDEFLGEKTDLEAQFVKLVTGKGDGHA